MTDLQPTFKALADPTRREILALLTKESLSIAQLAENFTMTRAAVKKHLVVLQDGGLIHSDVDGRSRRNSLNTQGMAPVVTWIESIDAFWTDRLDTLKSALEKDLNS
jgi:DNA-binding transcriptional ArsR family regulator